MTGEPPTPAATKSRGRSCLTAVLAVVGFLVVSSLLLMLPTGFIGPVFVLGGIVFFGLFTLHYLVWGRWLDAELRRAERNERGPAAGDLDQQNRE